MRAFLILENGTVYEGTHIGAETGKEVICEIVFDTSMTGYLEVLTNPAAAGQAVCMTYPLIGNYGVCREDGESSRAWAEALIVRELSRTAANFRANLTIEEYLTEQGICGIAGIDTRSLTKLLRINGTMSGCITTDEHYNHDDILARIKAWRLSGAVERVTCKAVCECQGETEVPAEHRRPGAVRFNEAAYRDGQREKSPVAVRALSGRGKKVAVLDTGLRRSLREGLLMRGCDVTVYPAAASAEAMLAAAPDGIMLCGGPGNPKDNPDLIRTVKKIYDSGRPILAVGLGYQLLALAAGGDTFKMKHGHRGANHPVRDLATGKVMITTQSHGYAVDSESLDPQVARAAYSQVNDGTCEGLEFIGKPILAIQFDPETVLDLASPDGFFERFMALL